MNTEQIRRGLRNIHSRSTTIDTVIEKGDTIIDEVLPLLQDRNEGVRWSAIKILSEIGDKRTIGSLIVLLEQSKNITDVANALHTITGRDLGDKPDAWRQWIIQEPELRNTAADIGILSNEDLITTATRDLPVTVSGKGQEYTIKVSLPEGRSQQIWIDLSTKDSNGKHIIQLTTPCGKADEQQYEYALKLNMSIPYGAIAIAELDGELYFAMVDTYLRETVHPEDVAKSIMSLARHGDSVEKSLSTEDKF